MTFRRKKYCNLAPSVYNDTVNIDFLDRLLTEVMAPAADSERLGDADQARVLVSPILGERQAVDLAEGASAKSQRKRRP